MKQVMVRQVSNGFIVDTDSYGSHAGLESNSNAVRVYENFENLSKGLKEHFKDKPSAETQSKAKLR